MTTLSFQITPTGASAPSFEDIIAVLTANVQAIYGNDTYLEPDSQDGQFISIFGTVINDLNQAGIAVYQSYSPTYAQGVGLSAQVKLNGIMRLVPTNSQQNMDVVGQAGKVINGGILADESGNQWLGPDTITIPPSGTTTQTFTAKDSGALAFVGSPTIRTPTPGWQSAALNGSTTVGQPVETDAALRQRQAASTALPALTPLPAIAAAVANITGVKRLYAYENDTGVADANAIPAHSISIVVEGGDAVAIASAIAAKKSPGTGTYGTTTEIIIDSVGVPNTINFFQLSVQAMHILVNMHNLSGFVTTTEALVQQSVAAYFDALDIGEDSYLGRLYSPVNLSGDAATEGTAMSQAALDLLSATYDIRSIYQARPNMSANGAVIAGATAVTVNSAANYAAGQAIGIVLDNNDIHYTTVTSVVGSVVNFPLAIPGGRSVVNGALVYVSGSVVMAFNEAASGVAANVTVVVS